MARQVNTSLAWLTLGAAMCSPWHADARADAAPRIFALIVANNRSSTLSIPDLQYADDDGARYYRLLVGAADAPRVSLLANLDRASQRVYPELRSVSLAPTRAVLEREVARLAEEVRAANAKGEATTFYFVYAGHGHVEGGRGYIDLEDQSVDGEFVEHQIIERVPASQKHVVLDSCNSFFVINPRKPGGRRWATPRDMALGFSARHPEVGLFLSTNSESEVFEWSELESGVFSHEVRSGLSGAADVNRDGQVSYAELAGFVDRTNAGISRESLRPRLFYRGPLGDANASLFSTKLLGGRHIALPDAQTRLWLKNQTGERLVDLHKEPGAMTVTVPARPNEELTMFVQRDPIIVGDHPTIIEQALTVESASVAERTGGSPPLVAARGDRLFGNLFAKPYGQAAFARYQKEEAQAPLPVYGVGDAELSRMHNYLSAMAAQGRYERMLGGSIYMGIGAVYAGTAIGSLYDRPRMNFVVPGAAAGAAAVGIGLYAMLSRSTSEDAFSAFEQELREHQGDHSLLFARTEETLQKVARRERLTRNVGFWVMESVGVATGALLTLTLVDRHNQLPDERLSPSAYGALFAGAGFLIVGGFLMRATDTPTERFLHLYQSDPGLKLQLGAMAAPGGGGLGVLGTF